MRLLQIGQAGQFSLVERVGNNIPPYAILSHTWGDDKDEVTYQDVLQGIAKSKRGYRKLQFCGDQAALDSLEFFWVDTCCIDKASSAELSEAINSMFSWYQKAAKCYVYLSDVFKFLGNHERTLDIWHLEFLHSKWFTRGWTLQELIGPRYVEFFSEEGSKLGDKSTLGSLIHQTTRIPREILQGSRTLADVSVAERIAWANGRLTRREEDAAYCLLGIFDVYMPLIYGEGRRRAFRRLEKEIREWTEGGPPQAFSKPKPKPVESKRKVAHRAVSGPPQPQTLPKKWTSYMPGEQPGFKRSKVRSVQSTRPSASRSELSVLLSNPPEAGSKPEEVMEDTDLNLMRNVVMWPGNTSCANFPEYYVEKRNQLSDAVKAGDWDRAFRMLESAKDEEDENWANAVRLRLPREADDLSFWTPLHQAVFQQAPVNVVKRLIKQGCLRTIRTRKSDFGPRGFASNDLTAAEMGQMVGSSQLGEILAPVILHPVPHRTLLQLETAFHKMIIEDCGMVPGLVLPDLVPLTELDPPAMWFPISVLGETNTQGITGYHYWLEQRGLVVKKFTIRDQLPIFQRLHAS